MAALHAGAGANVRVRYRIILVPSLLAAALVLASATSSATESVRGSKPVAARAPEAVGALFALNTDGTLSNHFCTGTVVHSPKGNVVLTAAHCVSNQTAGSFAFVPGYRNGSAPLGIWVVQKVFVDDDWANSADPDHDYAFLVVSGSGSSLESLTGADRLGAGTSAGKLATVAGYPASSERPIACRNALLQRSATELQFICGGYTNGTSGSALVVDPDPATGLGTVVGVIGGYEQGGSTASISYAAEFSGTTESLYEQALTG
jgi:V8-like Glu-specific endopeptidase